MSNIVPHPASYRDPSGFIFEHEGKIYRQVNKSYAASFEQLHNSGLYQQLVSKGDLIAHTETNINISGSRDWFTTLLPEQLPFISYPYEWCFDQLRDAALLTLSINRSSMEQGMILKDATPYNIQFLHGRPVFIDTLSFDRYEADQPWIAYRQFCENFLFPLYLEHYLGIDCIPWLRNYLDGIPVDTTARLLPWKSKWNLGVRLHVLLQNKIKQAGQGNGSQKIVFSKQKMLHLLQHLESIVANIKPGYPSQSNWSNYYEETILGQDYLKEKEKIFMKMLGLLNYSTVADLGANDGHFSTMLAKSSKLVIAIDSDSRCINRLYQRCKTESVKNIVPLVNDLSNPSPSLGFNNKERESLGKRIKADLVVALALIHHLAISKNLPLPMLANYFSSFSPQLIIEFVPKEDEKLKQLLSGRRDIFDHYTKDDFEKSFSDYYTILASETIPGTGRVLYCMKRK